MKGIKADEQPPGQAGRGDGGEAGPPPQTHPRGSLTTSSPPPLGGGEGVVTPWGQAAWGCAGLCRSGGVRAVS